MPFSPFAISVGVKHLVQCFFGRLAIGQACKTTAFLGSTRALSRARRTATAIAHLFLEQLFRRARGQVDKFCDVLANDYPYMNPCSSCISAVHGEQGSKYLCILCCRSLPYTVSVRLSACACASLNQALMYRDPIGSNRRLPVHS